MSRGKQKGFKKSVVEIKDAVLEPYYIVKDDRQFILMLTGNSLPQGYFVSLGSALQAASKGVHLNENAGTRLSIRQFIDTYDEINTRILQSIEA